MKVHGADAANLVQSPIGDGALELWHRRLGHLNVKDVHMLQNMVSDMNLGKFNCPTSSLFWEACIEGKQHRVAFPNEGEEATKPLEIVYFDMCGPMRITSMGGARYFMTFIDDFSRIMWLYVLKSKGKCFEKFKEFKALVEMQSEHKIKAFWSDNGREFVSRHLIIFLRIMASRNKHPPL